MPPKDIFYVGREECQFLEEFSKIIIEDISVMFFDPWDPFNWQRHLQPLLFTQNYVKNIERIQHTIRDFQF